MVGLAVGDGDVTAGPVAVGDPEASGELGGAGEEPSSASEVDDDAVGTDDGPADVANQGGGGGFGDVDAVPVERRAPEPDPVGGIIGLVAVSVLVAGLISAEELIGCVVAVSGPVVAGRGPVALGRAHPVERPGDASSSPEAGVSGVGRVGLTAEGAVGRAGVGAEEAAQLAFEGGVVDDDVGDDLRTTRRAGPSGGGLLEDLDQGIATPLTLGAPQIPGGGSVAVTLTSGGPVGGELGLGEAPQDLIELSTLQGPAPGGELPRAVEVLDHLGVTVLMRSLAGVAGAVLIGPAHPIGDQPIEMPIPQSPGVSRQRPVVTAQPLADPHVGVGPGDALDVADPDVADGERLPNRRQAAQRSGRAGPAGSFSIRQPRDVADQDLGRRMPISSVQTLPVDLIDQLHLHRPYPPTHHLHLLDQPDGVAGIGGLHTRFGQGVETRGDLIERPCGGPIDNL
ncbi:hypothetical protein BH23ACT2_BH23ACT2_01540 [soil metagenome]